MDSRIFEIVKNIAKEQLIVLGEKIKPETRFMNDLGADLLDTIEMTKTIEKEFNIEILDENLVNLVTVRQIVDYISRQLAGKKKITQSSAVANFQI